MLYIYLVKQLILILLLVVTGFSVNAQIEQVKIIAIDALGKSDTVVFGMDNSSTNGIDLSHGEINIYGQLFDSVDIRIIHRDSLDTICSPHRVMYSNVDLKREFRPYEGIPAPQYPDFVIRVHADSFPVLIFGDFSGLVGNFGNGWCFLEQFSPNCVSQGMFYGAGQIMTNQYLFTMSDSTESVITMRFEFEVGIDEQFFSGISIKPNPTTGNITIDFGEVQPAIKATLTNSLGQVVLTQNYVSTNYFNLDLAYPKGLYFLTLEMQRELITKKVIIE